MNFKESKNIFQEVKKADRILINCHRNPDLDSLGSAVALYEVLLALEKRVKIICPTQVQDYLDFIPNFKFVETVDFTSFDFGKFDLFIALDSSSWYMISGINDFRPSEVPVIVIDHHKTNEKYGLINLVKNKMTSTAEILFCLFEDWKVPLGKNVATGLMAGLIGDTGIFKFHGQTANTFRIASKLVGLGADKDDIVFKTAFSVEPLLVKFWGGLLSKLKVDKKYKFAYMAMNLEEFESFGSPLSGRELAALNFGQIINGTNFGIVMVEQEKGILSISFRSRSGFDTSRIAEALGGGGHVYASGAKIERLPFKKAVQKTLKVARSYAKDNKNIL